MNADGDVFSVTEANTRESTNGKIPEGLPGSKTMACMEKDSRNLGDPTCSPKRKPTGTPTQSKKRMADGKWGVGLVHSTPRTGELFTWGRDQQTYAARKGNMVWTAGLEKP